MVLGRRRSESLVLVAVLLYFAACPVLPKLSICPTAFFCNISCPTCGTCRSVWSILHGQLGDAAMLNPIGFIVVFVLIRRLAYLVFGETAVARISDKRIDYALLVVFIACLIVVPLLRTAGVMPVV